ncbi:MAG: hypothetical protein ABSF28_07750 [Terracidiphilus sp.]|jgi:hypothetical protein
MAAKSAPFAEDELDDITPRQPATRVNRPAVATTPTTVASTLPSDEDLADVGSETLIKPKAAKMLRPEKAGEAKRFGLIPQSQAPWKKAFTHAEKGKGVFRCLNPKKSDTTERAFCCRHFGAPTENFYTVVAHYPNAHPQSGALKTDGVPEVILVPLKLSNYAYSQIVGLKNTEQYPGDDIFNFDVKMTWAGSDLLKGYNFARMISPPRYLQLGEGKITQLLAEWKDGAKLSKAIARTLTESELRALVGGVEAPVDEEDEDAG